MMQVLYGAMHVFKVWHNYGCEPQIEVCDAIDKTTTQLLKITFTLD